MLMPPTLTRPLSFLYRQSARPRSRTAVFFSRSINHDRFFSTGKSLLADEQDPSSPPSSPAVGSEQATASPAASNEQAAASPAASSEQAKASPAADSEQAAASPAADSEQAEASPVVSPAAPVLSEVLRPENLRKLYVNQPRRRPDSAGDAQRVFTGALGRRGGGVTVPTHDMQMPGSVGGGGSASARLGAAAAAAAAAAERERESRFNPVSPTNMLPLHRGSAKTVEPPPLRLTPSIGRAVDLVPATGFDLALALRRLAAKLRENNLRPELIRQRFHERAGLRRKRLRRERWRRRFLKGFLATVQQVHQMRKQGW